MMHDVLFHPLGDQAIHIQWQQEPSPSLLMEIQQMDREIQASNFPEVLETVPEYTGLAVYYDVSQVIYEDIQGKLSSLIQKNVSLESIDGRVIEIPVCYGGAYGEDLESVANWHHVTPDDVVQKHAYHDYPIYMFGFFPGFPYLGGLSEDIATPRLDVPRQKVPQGSVGIAGGQTGIYPFESPGGWRLIGRTPVPLFFSDDSQPCIGRPGDALRFIPIADDEYQRIEREVEAEDYVFTVIE